MDGDENEKVLAYSSGDLTQDMGPLPREERNQTMEKFTGEMDYEFAPESQHILDWRFFCSDFYSSDRKIAEVEDICQAFPSKLVDLRPYMAEQPYVVVTTDKLPKCLELFRHMHLRALPVNDPNSGLPVAVLTR